MALQGSDFFVIERAGAVYSILGSDVLSYVQDNLGTTQFQAADITARNALTGLTLGDVVLVTDASADATVTSGWAMYRWMGAAWQKIAEEESLDFTVAGTDLGYTASAGGGVITSSSGADANIPTVSATNAGLMFPGQHTKLAFITVTAAVNLDTLAAASHAAVTLAGTTNTNPLTLSEQALGFSISQLTAAP